MSNAQHDQNNRPTAIAVSSSDGRTIVQLQANPVNHALEIDDDTTGSDNGNNEGSAMIDENCISVFMAESSDGSGDLIEVYADPLTNKLLIDSN